MLYVCGPQFYSRCIAQKNSFELLEQMFDLRVTEGCQCERAKDNVWIVELIVVHTGIARAHRCQSRKTECAKKTQ